MLVPAAQRHSASNHTARRPSKGGLESGFEVGVGQKYSIQHLVSEGADCWIQHIAWHLSAPTCSEGFVRFPSVSRQWWPLGCCATASLDGPTALLKQLINGANFAMRVYGRRPRLIYPLATLYFTFFTALGLKQASFNGTHWGIFSCSLQERKETIAKLHALDILFDRLLCTSSHLAQFLTGFNILP